MTDKQSLPLHPDAPIVTIFGGSGFIGRATARLFAQSAWRVRIASRRPKPSLFSDLPHIEWVSADPGDKISVETAIEGSSAVVNVTGILSPTPGQSFDQVHHLGPRTIASAVASQGIVEFVHVSAIGADPLSKSSYARSKAAGEKDVLAAFPQAIILRPSIVFGPEDSFFNRFALMAKYSPFLPLIGGGKTLFQPVYVNDVASAIVTCIEGKGEPGQIYELGGPERKSFTELLKYICFMKLTRRFLVPLSFPLAYLVASVIESFNTMLGGRLPSAFLITRDQVTLLKQDNVVSNEAVMKELTLKGLGISSQSIEAIVPSYLRAK